MMMADLMKGIAGPIDLKAETNIHLEMTRASVANTISNPLTDDARIHHVPYKDFVSDPIGTIRGYYGFAGRKFTPQAEGAMPNYLATNNGGNSVSVIDGSTRTVTATVPVGSNPRTTRNPFAISLALLAYGHAFRDADLDR